MRNYAETPFLKEVAYRQGGHRLCLRMLAVAERGGGELRIPAVSLVEAAGAITEGRATRKTLRTRLKVELDQSLRSEHPDIPQFEADATALAARLDALDRRERRRFDRLRKRLLAAGCVIPATARALTRAAALELPADEAPTRRVGYGATDAAILGSVLADLADRPTAEAAFVTSDRRFLKHPQVRTEAERAGLTLYDDLQRLATDSTAS